MLDESNDILSVDSYFAGRKDAIARALSNKNFEDSHTISPSPNLEVDEL